MKLTSDFLPLFAFNAVMEYSLFGGAILLVAGVLLLWAVTIRKPARTRRYKYRRMNREETTAETTESNSKRRRRRRSELPRNPTLAETRGLPPVRNSQSSSNEHYQY